MAKLKDPTQDVTEKDLNGIDMLNGTASVGYNQIYPMENGEYPKGSANPLKYKGNNANLLNTSLFKNDGGSLKTQTTIIVFLNSLIENATELVEWDGLPDDLDKYILEYGLLTNGIIGILPILGGYQCVNVLLSNNKDKENTKNLINTQRSFYNMGYLPYTVQVMNTGISSIDNEITNKTFVNGKDIFLIRNNLNCQPMLMKVARFLELYEKIIFQFEKNNVSASSKVIAFDQNAESNNTNAINEKNLNNMLNSENVGIIMEFDTELLSRLKDTTIRTPFLPLELKDRVNELSQAWTFVKNEIKEVFGFDILQLGGKKERALNSEIDASNSLSSYYLKHRINIRNNDIKNFNKTHNFNIKVSEVIDENQISNSDYGDEAGKNKNEKV